MFASPTLDALVNAAASFSAAIGQQLVFVQNEPAPAELSEKTIAYAQAKTAYITALRGAMPELINIATGKESRPAQLDKYSAAFSIAGEKQEKAADERHCCYWNALRAIPAFEKGKAEFERAQNVEETFHKDFDGIDFTSRRTDG